jgi:hypothetical protein
MHTGPCEGAHAAACVHPAHLVWATPGANVKAAADYRARKRSSAQRGSGGECGACGLARRHKAAAATPPPPEGEEEEAVVTTRARPLRRPARLLD